MDREVLRMVAHLDQTRCTVRQALAQLGDDGVIALVKTCAGNRVDELDERMRLLVGLLAVVAIFHLNETEDQR